MPTRSSQDDPAAIRRRAQASGYKVSERGRLPAEVVATYRKPWTCGFCSQSGLHEHCPGSVRNGSSVGTVMVCACTHPTHRPQEDP